MISFGFEESHLRRKENKKFCFERNKKENFEESLLVKKGKNTAVSSFTAGKSPQPANSPLFGDPLSSNPMYKKLKAEMISAAIFQKKPMAAAPLFNPSSLAPISSSSRFSSSKGS